MWNTIVNICRYFALGVVVMVTTVSLMISSIWVYKQYEDYQKLSGQQAIASCKKEGIPVLKADLMTLDRCVILKDLPSGTAITINLR